MESTQPTIRTVKVLYCGICKLPVEYCEFNTPSTATECKSWLSENHNSIFQLLYPQESLDLQQLSLDGQSDQPQPAPSKSKPPKQKSIPKIIIKRVERNKRKYVTCISGLELHNVELKKAAKLFANKFATGSSVTKNAQGSDEIVVQGDLQDDIFELIIKTFNISEDVIDLIDGKR